MGTLYIVATPIGNLEDITIRAIRTLFSVDYIACEDTRRMGILLNNLVLRTRNQELTIKNLIIKKPKVISYYDEIEFKRIPVIIGLLNDNKDVALVSDSGTPLISDPGYKLVNECIKRNIPVVSIPGPSSLLTALTVSGLPSDRFLFLGYLPSKQTKRLTFLTDLLSDLKTAKQLRLTVIFFESPHRLRESLSDIKDVLGDTEIVICRELTKVHEEVWKGKISRALNYYSNPKGEFVILYNIKNPYVSS